MKYKQLLHLTNEAQMSLRQVQERHDEFIKLQESVQEVHDLFFEVGLIVDSQVSVKTLNLFIAVECILCITQMIGGHGGKN